MDMKQILKQAQKMQKKMAEQQEQLAAKIFEASSGGGMVTAKVSGNNQLVELIIDPEVVDKEDVGMLQDLVVAAVNEAHHRAQEEMQSQMQSMMGGMKIPGLM